MIYKNYISRKSQLLKNFDRTIARVKHVLISCYGEEQAKTFIRESRLEYETLIPQIPYIGDKNPFLIFLLPAVRSLAIYRALQKQGGTVEDARQLIYEMSETELQAILGFVRRVIGYFWFSPWLFRRIKKRAKESQEREYHDSFVMSYIIR